MYPIGCGTAIFQRPREFQLAKQEGGGVMMLIVHMRKNYFIFFFTYSTHANDI